jgi:hypothetical protein
MELLALAALLAVAWVETARALGGKPLRNDIVMIFTDGEGLGCSTLPRMSPSTR